MGDALEGRSDALNGEEMLKAELLVLSNLDVSVEDFLKDLEERGEQPDFMNAFPSAAFKNIDRLLNRLFLEVLTVMIPESSLQPAMKDIFTNCDWKSVPENSPAKIALLGVYAKMQHLRGQLVGKYVEESSAAREHLNPIVQIEYHRFGQIADVTNQFYIKWVQDAGRILDTEGRQKRGFTDEFSTIGLDSSGQPQQVKWHVAFPEETALLSDLYQRMADVLASKRQLDEDQGNLNPDLVEVYERKIAYYRALSEGWATSDLEKWRIADTMLPGQTNGKNLPVHIHTIEVGYGADRIQRDPEASLRAPDEDFRNINEIALGTRTRMAAILRDFFRDSDYSDALKGTVGLMEKSVFAARHFMGSGTEMEFKPAGQILPNEDASRAAGGLDISADPETMGKRVPLIRESYKAVFGEDFFEDVGDVPEMMGRRVASHEFSHAIGITPDLNQRVDVAVSGPFGEEWKATVGGMIADEYLPYLKGQNTVEDLRRSVHHHMAMCPRYTSMRSSPHALAYLRKSCMIAKVAVDNGVIVEDGQRGYKLDLQDDKLLAFYRGLMGQYEEYLTVYDRGNTDDLKAFLGKNLQPIPYLDWQAQKIDTHFGNTGLISMEDVCKVA